MCGGLGLTRVPRLLRFRTATIDAHPWEHPFLTRSHIERFRKYSDEVHAYAAAHAQRYGYPDSCTFTVNMAQNMYKWAAIASEYGVRPTLIPHPMDASAVNDPRWEDFDGEYGDIQDGSGFRELLPEWSARVPMIETRMDGEELLRLMTGRTSFRERVRDLGTWRRLRKGRYRELWTTEACYPYFEWAKLVEMTDVSYAAASPIASYACGKPYLTCSVGGDLQIECGRTDEASNLLRTAFAAAAFLLISNPHTLGHSRRLGLNNGVHVPYPMDTSRYSPGEGRAREWWKGEFGGEVFVLATARVDSHVKGFNASLVDSLATVARLEPDVRFVFLAWGHSVPEFRTALNRAGVADRVILLPPVGKVRLIDYYRSCDIVLDQQVYGYFGASALEALSVGRPVVMPLRQDQYAGLYADDVAPVVDPASATSLAQCLVELVGSVRLRRLVGERSREWILRHHSEEVAGRKMMNLLALAAAERKLPRRIRRLNPLTDPLSDAEHLYHARCAT